MNGDNGETPNPLLRSTTRDTDGVLSLLRTARDGLSPEEAALRLRRSGPNELHAQRGPSLPRQLLGQLFHFFALMLWVAAVLAFVGRMPQLGVAIILVILMNAAFSFAQEYRAERAVRALSALLPETALVRRGGRQAHGAGARARPRGHRPAPRGRPDLRRRPGGRVHGLKVDISTLTGESKPARARHGPVDRTRLRPARRAERRVRRHVRHLGGRHRGRGRHRRGHPTRWHLHGLPGKSFAADPAADPAEPGRAT